MLVAPCQSLAAGTSAVVAVRSPIVAGDRATFWKRNHSNGTSPSLPPRITRNTGPHACRGYSGRAENIGKVWASVSSVPVDCCRAPGPYTVYRLFTRCSVSCSSHVLPISTPSHRYFAF